MKFLVVSRKTSVFFLLSFFALLGLIGSIFVTETVFASAASESAFRSVSVALEALLAKIDASGSGARISSLAGTGETCVEKTLRGENVYGRYEIAFFDASNAELSCFDQISSLARLRGTGYSGGESIVISRMISERVTPRCFGNRPDFTVAYTGDETGLAESFLWKYSATNTERKCEYACRTGFVWNGVTCGSTGGGGSVSGLCGSAARDYAVSETSFSGPLCERGSASPSAPVFPSPGASVSWKCLGENGGGDASCTASRTASGNNSCSLYGSGSAVPDGYGPPFDVLSSNRVPTLVVSCENFQASAMAGNAGLSTFVYRKGFVSESGSWRSISFSGTPATSNDGWFAGVATASALPLPASGRTNFVLAFICRYYGSVWKCGCRDSACEQNYWTIQGYGR